MIVVLVPHFKPLEVLERTPEEFVRMVRELGENGQYLATWPPGRTPGDFENAWRRYTGDLKHARHFDGSESALAWYVGTRENLTVLEHARILKLLYELDSRPARWPRSARFQAP